MSKIAVVYWSGTGNTLVMANAVEEGAKNAGAEVMMLGPSDFNRDKVGQFDAIAFGCPAMGAETLEEQEYEPMFSEVEGALSGKRSHCLALTVGETDSGCATGRKDARLREQN